MPHLRLKSRTPNLTDLNKYLKRNEKEILMSKLVDNERAIDELGLDLADFIEFMGDLKEFFDECVPELGAYVEAKDFDGIKDRAHAIKGAAANLRFVGVADIAFFLEKAGKESNPDGIEEKFKELAECVTLSFEEVKDL